MRPPALSPQGVSRPSVSQQTGPSMSTEPGWTAAAGVLPYLLGERTGEGHTTTPACC